MTWYAAHIVMSVEFKNAVQDRFPVWENIILINAAGEEEAFERAEECGRAQEGDDEGTFKWGARPAQWVFEGVRKLTECALHSGSPGDGDEVSFNELELSSRQALRRFVQGKPVDTRYNDRYSAPAPHRKNAVDDSKPRKRKHA